MKDNFDLKGYLRHGNKLLNESIGGYMDLKPLNELDNEDFFGDDPEEMQMVWMEDVTDKQINDWSCFYEYQMGTIGMESPRFPGIALYASPGFEGADGIVFEAWDEEGNNIDLNPDNPKTNQYVAGKSIYTDFESYAEDMEKILPTVESILKGGGEEEMNEGEPEGDQYDGQYDAHTGPAITSEEEDDDYDPLPWANKGGFDFEDFQDTNLEGPGVEMSIDNLIADYDQAIKTSVPKELQYSARIAVKKLWLEKIKNWRS